MHYRRRGTQAGVKTYYLYNGHGDVTQLTNASGNVIRSYDYDAFGNLVKEETYSNYEAESSNNTLAGGAVVSSSSSPVITVE